jgi:L-alanine-DL-glutamate epimerase-like enolase superfamily enzyme
MHTINDLEFFVVAIERTGGREPVRSLLVRLTTDSGVEGWGESGLGWRPEELSARRDVLLPVLAGRSIFDIEDLHTLDALPTARLRAAVEMACWDLVGKAAGLPLCQLFGGEYRQRIPLAVRLAGRRPDRLAQAAREMAAHGFQCHIIGSCGRIEVDRQMLLAVREGVGDRVELRLDAQGGYDLEAARDLCSQIEFEQVRFVIDPIRGADLYAVATLGRQTSVPLAVWRTIHSPADVLLAARSGAAQAVVLDLDQLGGLAPARAAAAVASAAGITAILGSRPALGIGTAAMLHLAASNPVLSGCNECAYSQLRDDILSEPLEIAGGMMTVPEGPGLGIEVERAKVERYLVG